MKGCKGRKKNGETQEGDRMEGVVIGWWQCEKVNGGDIEKEEKWVEERKEVEQKGSRRWTVKE
ncbi:hypothetical protein [Escherichia coli]|uniref:hypothetical protein n=1 Tax=Escherichia coli TaxID=562 RepID=UPI00098B2502|nr:hypothetical protein [Escherichia coli]